ncbi:MAG: hypothetical protein IJ419_06730 [Agathobacter sp.]|nr:hypothetical protein [Agathobacter sp.]
MSKINVCDYDEMILYKSGEFNCKYKTNLDGKLKSVERQTLSKEEEKSFLDAKYETYETLEDVILYRVFGKYIGKNTGKEHGAGILGAYATTEFAESIIDVKNRLALLPQWRNTKMFELKFCLPKGSVINIGITAPQPPREKTFAGGAEQIILPRISREEMDKWVIGYRRIGARQLTKIPSYPFTSVEEVVESINLYSVFCPECQSSHIHTIKDDEKKKYTFTGSKGGIYTMQYRCLNPQCEYMW